MTYNELIKSIKKQILELKNSGVSDQEIYDQMSKLTRDKITIVTFIRFNTSKQLKSKYKAYSNILISVLLLRFLVHMSLLITDYELIQEDSIVFILFISVSFITNVLFALWSLTKSAYSYLCASIGPMSLSVKMFPLYCSEYGVYNNFYMVFEIISVTFVFFFGFAVLQKIYPNISSVSIDKSGNYKFKN